MDTRVLPLGPKASHPISGYVLTNGFDSMHRLRSSPVYQHTIATTKRSIKLNHPPSARAYGIDSIPTPAELNNDWII